MEEGPTRRVPHRSRRGWLARNPAIRSADCRRRGPGFACAAIGRRSRPSGLRLRLSSARATAGRPIDHTGSENDDPPCRHPLPKRRRPSGRLGGRVSKQSKENWRAKWPISHFSVSGTWAARWPPIWSRRAWVAGYDLIEAQKQTAAERAWRSGSAREAVAGAEVIVTMLPAGRHVRRLGHLLPSAPRGALIIDSSTIDVESAREAHEAGAAAGMLTLDAPVSGGVGGATGGTLTFMCGGARRLSRGQADPRGDGQAHRPLRRRGRRAGGENLQQHDPRRDHDRHLRGLRARRKARPLGPGARTTSPRPRPASPGR